MKKKKSNNILTFPDGKFAFWVCEKEGFESHCFERDIIIRTRLTGKGKEARNPKERIRKLAHEYANQGMIDLGDELLKCCKKFKPAEPHHITSWLSCHVNDLHDFMKKLLDK